MATFSLPNLPPGAGVAMEPTTGSSKHAPGAHCWGGKFFGCVDGRFPDDPTLVAAHAKNAKQEISHAQGPPAPPYPKLK